MVILVEIRTRLNDWKFQRAGEVQQSSLGNPPRVSGESAKVVKIGRAIPTLTLSSAVNRYSKEWSSRLPGTFFQRRTSARLRLDPRA